MPQPDSPTVNLTILAVDDPQRAAGFYRSAFGWPPRVEVEVYVELVLPGDRGLGLYQREAFGANTDAEPAPRPAEGTTGTELYLRCADVERSMAALEEAGAKPLTPLAPRPWGDDVAYFADLDGNVIALARLTN